MPIIVRRENPSDLLSLASQSGRAVGTAERRARQESFDQQFIHAAIQASAARNSGPGYFERESQGHAAESYARQDQADRVDLHRAKLADEHDLNQAKLDLEYDKLGTKGDVAAEKARAAQELTAFRREQFKSAAAQGPDALAAFLTQEAFATGKSSVPAGYVDAMKKKKGSGPDERKGVSNFQHSVEGQIQGGRANDVLGYAGQREEADYSNFTPGGTVPQGPLSTKAMETISALEFSTGKMDKAQLEGLRRQIATGSLSQEVKSASMSVVDKALQQRSKMRDVEIAQVYDESMRRATEQVIHGFSSGAAPVPREQMRAKVGRAALDIARQYGISPAEFSDWVSRMNSAPTGP